jgi:DNA-binding transcriptional regulator GbsR (MarR family)
MPENGQLSEFEQSLVALGISAASAFSLPKSVGAMFGLTFASPVPLALDDYVHRLDISKGSASQGLKFLQRIGAVKTVYLPSDRRTLYEPEMSLRRLLIGILNENVLPHLQQSGERVASLREQLEQVENAEDRELLKDRLDTLEGWGKKGRMLMPLAERMLSGPLKRK